MILQCTEPLSPCTAFICFLAYGGLDGKNSCLRIEACAHCAPQNKTEISIGHIYSIKHGGSENYLEDRCFFRNLGRELGWEHNLDAGTWWHPDRSLHEWMNDVEWQLLAKASVDWKRSVSFTFPKWHKIFLASLISCWLRPISLLSMRTQPKRSRFFIVNKKQWVNVLGLQLEQEKLEQDSHLPMLLPGPRWAGWSPLFQRRSLHSFNVSVIFRYRFIAPPLQGGSRGRRVKTEGGSGPPFRSGKVEPRSPAEPTRRPAIYISWLGSLDTRLSLELECLSCSWHAPKMMDLWRWWSRKFIHTWATVYFVVEFYATFHHSGGKQEWPEACQRPGTQSPGPR